MRDSEEVAWMGGDVNAGFGELLVQQAAALEGLDELAPLLLATSHRHRLLHGSML